ncbi:hypothetical protein [Micromonospora sp. NBRC 107095]|uniref:hypothetical protein n=1 Tax=Micromonospora sp. NBRC 107095 TaxID=3032209 RepID=UPI0025530A26|nr:hypothetical protein [Micromonospora sp. NBRC 107095]
MNRRHVAVAATMIVAGVAGLVVGVVQVASGEAALVGLVAIGALVAVLGAVLLRDTARAARQPGGSGRRRPGTDESGHSVYPGPTGDVGSEWHVNRQRDGDTSGGTESVGGTSGDSGWGWSSGDSGGGWSGGGGDSGGGGGGS